jgi:putative ABC transport system permease protein
MDRGATTGDKRAAEAGMIPISYNWRSLTARRSTTLAAAFGIALVVFVFASVLMLSNGIEETMRATGTPRNAIILRKGSQAEMQSGIEQAAVSVLRAAPEAAAAAQGTLSTAEVVVLITATKSGTSGVTNVVVRGVSPESFQVHEKVKIVEGRNFTPGTDEVVVGRGIATRLVNVAVGQEISLQRNRSVKIVGLFSADGSSFESEIWGDLNTVRAIFNRQGSVSSVTLRLKDPNAFETLKTRIGSDPRLGLDVKRESAYYEEQSQGLSIFIRALGLVIAVFFSVGAMIGAMITMYAQIAQRGREIGTLRALGFRRRKILASFLLESVLLALAGGAIGILGALAMSFVRFSTISFQSFSEVVFRFSPTLGILGAALAFASVMGLLGGLFPAIRAARVAPVQAMRE